MPAPLPRRALAATLPLASLCLLAACSGADPTDSTGSAISTGADGIPAGDPPERAEPTTARPDGSATTHNSAAAATDASATAASATTAEPPPTSITLAVVGDVMLARGVGHRIAAEGSGAPFRDVRQQLAGADLTIANLESPLGTTGVPETRKTYAFLAPPDSVEVLLDGGIDVVSLANNHILDYGPVAMRSTQEALDGAGIVHMGVGEDRAEAHEAAVVEVDGMRLAFLSYMDTRVEYGGFLAESWTAGADTPGVAWAESHEIAADVAAVADQVDHVVVLLHSGRENTSHVNDDQRAHAEAAFDAGATLVLGHHPHVLQGYQLAEGQLVAYSLGNFVFDAATTETTESVILHVGLDHAGVTEIEWTPVQLVNGFPQALDPDEGYGREILQRFEALPID